jgi:ABC-type uncharacterized transport system substrate-binding protein
VNLTNGASAVAAMLQATRTLSIVFPSVPDPVAAGFVDRLARSGGNELPPGEMQPVPIRP